MLSDNDTMKLYMQHIAQYPLVTPEEEVELAAQIKAGSEAARIKLIRSNLRLVVKIAHDFKGLGLPLLDLISEGNIGLMRAVEKFDPSKGAKLSSYAAWWIKQSIKRALLENFQPVHIPTYMVALINQWRHITAELESKLGRKLSIEEMAEIMQLPLRKAKVVS